MSAIAAPDAAIDDATLALHLFVANPGLFGGIVLRGDGPVRDAMVAFAREAIGSHAPVVKIPASVDSERRNRGRVNACTTAARARCAG